jgi:hypothetical protein
MEFQAINPYEGMKQKFKDGLDFIISETPSEPSFDELNSVAIEYVKKFISDESEQVNFPPFH